MATITNRIPTVWVKAGDLAGLNIVERTPGLGNTYTVTSVGRVHRDGMEAVVETVLDGVQATRRYGWDESVKVMDPAI